MRTEEALSKLRMAVTILEGTAAELIPMSLQERVIWAETGWDFRVGDLAIIDLKKRRDRAIMEGDL